MARALPFVVDPQPVLRTWTRAEFEQLIDIGLFDQERLELLDGQITAMSPQGPVHAAVNQVLNELFMQALNRRAIVRVQSPFAAGEQSRPEPDFAIVPFGDYFAALPDEAHLLIEIAHSSLRIDRTLKAALYAECDVPEYWIINLVDEVVEVHTQPQAGRYGQVRTLRRGERVELVALPGIAFDVEQLLPPTK